MQFKHPEFLYFLALGIIPILIHLFQLQKFVKVPFTNVAFLQKIALQTRKSSQLKKWLILATRLLLLFALVLAFTQPYFSNKTIDEKQHSFIYLDNSMSTNAKSKKGNILQHAAQGIINSMDNEAIYSLLTNTNFYKNITSSDLKNELLEIKNTGKKTDFNAVLLKIANETNPTQKNVLISDFQNSKPAIFKNTKEQLSLVQLLPEQKNNLAIDSIFITKNTTTTFEINAIVTNQGTKKQQIPIALFNDDKLISKQTFSIQKNAQKTIQFTVQKTPVFLGKLHINFKDSFGFDNVFFFAVNSNQKIPVLAIGDNTHFLSKIYTKDEFDFTSTILQKLNYNAIAKQQLIILNELESIPQTLLESLVDFSKNGGNLVIIPNPNPNLPSYNVLLKSVHAGKINSKKENTLKITTINYKHPFFKNVFDKKVTNFQYPTVQTYFPSRFSNASTLVSFENNEPFIKQVNLGVSKLFWAASPLRKSKSNFTNSPLIVPIFYNIGQQSLHVSKLYYTIDKTNQIAISKTLQKEAVLTITNNETSFIPVQQRFQNKIVITTKEQPLQTGFYQIRHEKETIENIAFNYPKEESLLQFLDLNLIKDNTPHTFSSSVKDTLQEITQKNKVKWFWKWFLLLAIVSLLLEILILKFFKS